MRPSPRPRDPARSHRWRVGLVIAACLVIVAGGLSFLATRDSSPASTHQAATAATGAASASGASAPHVSPPTAVCGNKSILGGGPATAPAGAVTVPAGDDSSVNWNQPHTTFWFAPGVHTVGSGQFAQIDPAASSAFIGAPGAVLDGQHTNLYAFGGPAANVRISYLTVQNFGPSGSDQNEGVVNHDSAAGWTIDHSTLQDNAGAGTMLGSDNTLSYDCLKDNEQYGFNAYSVQGPASLLITHNEIAGNDTYNWEKKQPGCGCTGGGKFWDVDGAVIKDNWVHGNHSVGLWADTDNRGFDIENNYIASNYNYGITYEISYNALIRNNVFVRNGLGAGPTNPGFPTSAIYLSESGSDPRVPGKYGQVLQVTDNTFLNNWGGVVLWENSNRFCGSPANTSSGNCTLVAPGTATLSSCGNSSKVAHQPYYSDCRWQTKNVLVSHNEFDFNPASIGSSCTVAKVCGFQGVFSEYGTYPSWSPYQGTVVEKHIAFGQNNHFTANTYSGPWRFMAPAQGAMLTWSAWRAAPYHQDAGSTMKP
jgi:Right handed beta helix region